ncbi:S8 family serine peptidase [Jiangella alkaliphila]|uniref:Serine protease, subtilisin family n=1 Tax=Jiangella alkaliphila TaxID=419479 RepID=A0A1H2K022_9ACTN|nr:S8 family serine peptidase [Jiangella alkaliphila]SDU61746.1 Serine protease, subtilisin family [Jiangella alkaliphila]
MGRLRRATAALASIIGLTGTALILPGAPTAGVEGPDPAPPVAAGPPSALAGLERQTYELTLVTGDRVTVERQAPGDYTVDTEPATRPDGSVPGIQVTNEGESDALYAIPDDVRGHLESGLLDRQLFDVAYLAENGYAGRTGLPLIVEYAGAQDARTLAGHAAALAATDASTPLDSIDATAVTVGRDGAAAFWASLTGGRDRLAAGIERVWLDPAVSVSLDQSIPQIGADDAWAAGLDGAGVTVAVLDTGVDAAHPDVAGQVAASQSFIPGEDVADGHGHGTHVASTVAGTGAASDGRFTGVAPGAQLVVGKVLSNAGSSVGSSVIAGMEWASVEQDADIVSMSLGGTPTDGTDPLSQAVDALTEQTGALFVVAAGNAGRDFYVGTPGAADAALTVGAVDRNDALAAFSSRGPRRGDYAIKPEITAPGVAIGAARSAGTSMPGAVHIDDHYTRVSGTSMATPHVAGAAAILAQQHPDWTAQQLKAALVAGADDGDYTVYEQGAGRLDVTRAIGQQVQVSPSTADFGFLRLPVEGDAAARTLTYTNPTDAPVTLDLAATARSEDGADVPADALRLDRDTVDLPAGGSATVVVTFDQNAVEPALYTGSVVATAPGIRLGTPLGIVIGEQLHTVTVRQLHSGDPAGWHPSSVTLAPIDGEADASTRAGWVTEGAGAGGVRSPEEWAAGVEFALPTGTYIAFTNNATQWYDAETGGTHRATLVDPEVEVSADGEIVLDAADAVPVSFDTPLPTEGFQRRYLLQRWVPDHVAAGGGFVTLAENPTTTNGRDDYRVTPTDEVSTGEFRLVVENTLVAPSLTMRAEGHDELALRPQYPEWGSPFATVVPPGFTVAEPAVDGVPAAAAPGPVVRTGAEVEVSVRVANPAGAPARTGLRADTPVGAGSCASETLAGGQSTTCGIRTTAAAGPQVLPVVVTGFSAGAGGEQVPLAAAAVAHYTGADDPADPPPPPGTAVAIVAATVSGLAATRAPGPELEIATDLTIQATVRNTGTTTLNEVAAGSDLGPLTCPRQTLAPGEEATCTVPAEVVGGRHAIVVTATGRAADGPAGGAATVVYYTGRGKPVLFSGHQELDVVDAGFGTPAELAGLDLQGALVLLRADPARFDGRPVTCWPTREAVDAAVAAGAAGVVLTPNEEHLFRDRPGSDLDGMLWCPVAPRLGSSELAPIDNAVTRVPVTFVPYDQGAALRELAAGDLRIAVDGTTETPYYYQLRPALEGGVPDSLHFTVDEDELVTIDHRIHAGATNGIGVSVAAWQPTDAAAGPRTLGTRALPPFATTAPWTVTEYSWPLDPETVVRHEVQDFTSPAGRQVRYDVFDEPTRTTMVWNDSPPVPAPVPPLAGTAPIGYQTHGYTPVDMAPCTGCREGDVFYPHLRYTASADPGQIGWDSVGQFGQLRNDRNTRLYRDGVEVAGGPDPVGQTLLAFQLPPEPADYRLTHRLGPTETAWEFTSGTVEEDQLAEPYSCDSEWMTRLLEQPPLDTPCSPEPLIFLRYDLGLDLTNRAEAPGPQRIEVTTHRQPSLEPMPDVVGLRLWVSYDEGGEWSEARVRPRADGRFDVTALHRPASRRASDVVSLRVEAWDEEGNRVEQTIRNAYRLTDRSAAGSPR